MADPAADTLRGAGSVECARSTVAIVGIARVLLVPSPYVIEQPGPVFNTLGTVEHADERRPDDLHPRRADLHDRRDARHAHGRLRRQPRAAAQLVPGDLRLDRPEPGGRARRRRLPVGYRYEDSEHATARSTWRTRRRRRSPPPSRARLRRAGHGDRHRSSRRIPRRWCAEERRQDRRRRRRGTSRTCPDLRAAIAKAGTERPLSIGVERDGKRETVSVVPVLSAGRIRCRSSASSPRSTTRCPSRSRSSWTRRRARAPARCSPWASSTSSRPARSPAGRQVAGTGTIDANGSIGPIGGIRQKMFGALERGREMVPRPGRELPRGRRARPGRAAGVRGRGPSTTP